jgi:uncharacterized membrane protein
MGKLYTHNRPDFADIAAVQAAADANIPSYPAGAQYVIAAGVRIVVVTNDGTTVVLGTVTVV